MKLQISRGVQLWEIPNICRRSVKFPKDQKKEQTGAFFKILRNSLRRLRAWRLSLKAKLRLTLARGCTCFLSMGRKELLAERAMAEKRAMEALLRQGEAGKALLRGALSADTEANACFDPNLLLLETTDSYDPNDYQRRYPIWDTCLKYGDLSLFHIQGNSCVSCA